MLGGLRLADVIGLSALEDDGLIGSECLDGLTASVPSFVLKKSKGSLPVSPAVGGMRLFVFSTNTLTQPEEA